ncbi:hypothetical protein LGK97_10595 [Clostridium sp. CS001]|uniref:hypothetical protein n=1 Tax=Clostridium sp. CS001 TaxID=2880648 RepID=UPI001CF59CAB|nr:hypothetical protein [Clostridium sp. CS001]MCB2290216.1 hypothetical protein [Clostridium sp. CS001]
MSSLRQIRTLVALDLTLIIFVAWMAITNFLFENIVNYKLFFLSLALVFLMQCIYIKKSNKYISIILPIIVSMPFMWILFDGLGILLNLVFVIVSLFANLAMEVLPVNYEEYKSKAKLGAVIIGIVSIMSFWLEKSIVDYLFRFFVNYIIVTAILLRESRAYYYKVTKTIRNTEKTKEVETIKGLVINILFKYGIVLVSTIMLTTDWFLKKSLNVLNGLNKFMDVVTDNILDLIIKIVGPIVDFIVDILRRLSIKMGISIGFERFSKGFNEVNPQRLDKNGATISDNMLWKSALKIIILCIIILFIVDVVKKMKFMKVKDEQYTEEKEKINKGDKDLKNHKHRKNVLSILKNAFRMNNTIKEKILNAYRDFEIITKKDEIYNPSMTATQLKNKTKVRMENHNYLDEMTDIYNEVKFSNYESNEEQLDLVKKSLDNVKKQL